MTPKSVNEFLIPLRLGEIRYEKTASKAVNVCDVRGTRRKLGRTFRMAVNQIAFGHAQQEAA